MATDKSLADYIISQIETPRIISYRKMFGEYALYCDEKVVALICDNRLFVKPTEAGRNHIGQVVEAPPYRGAKNYFQVDDMIENSDKLSRLIELTADELPLPKIKKKPKK